MAGGCTGRSTNSLRILACWRPLSVLCFLIRRLSRGVLGGLLRLPEPGNHGRFPQLIHQISLPLWGTPSTPTNKPFSTKPSRSGSMLAGLLKHEVSSHTTLTFGTDRRRSRVKRSHLPSGKSVDGSAYCHWSAM